jgi:integrase
MAHVEDRWEKVVAGQRVRTDRYGQGARWKARYRDPTGRERSKTFRTKAEAERFLIKVESDKLRGAFLDPAAGRVTVQDFGTGWLEAQTFDASTREAVELRLRLHVYPHLGTAALSSVRPSQVQAWAKLLSRELAPRYVRVIMANFSAVMAAAVDDELIARNPCSASSVRPPRLADKPLIPWTPQQVADVGAALPDRFALITILGGGLGLRQGEIFGLAVGDIDFLRGVVHVNRQVKLLANRQVFALPKGRKVRDVPLPESVKLEIARHGAMAGKACPLAVGGARGRCSHGSTAAVDARRDRSAAELHQPVHLEARAPGGWSCRWSAAGDACSAPLLRERAARCRRERASPC